MITIYVKTGCPYCARVLGVLDTQSIPYDMKNIADDAVMNELISLGGKRQVPFLIDEDVSLYESQDIIDYINAKYQVVQGEDSSSDSAKSSGVCPIK